MNKLYYLFAALLLQFAVSSCDNTTTQQKIEAFDQALETCMNEYQERNHAIEMDDELILSGKSKEAYEENYNKTVKTIAELVNSTARKYPTDTVSLYALQVAMSNISDLSEIKPAIKAVAKHFNDNEFVNYLQEMVEKTESTSEGRMFTDFTVSHFVGDSEDGEPQFSDLSLSDFVGKGKYILVDFWSPWCRPCRDAVPFIKTVYEKYAGDDFDVLSVAVWEESRGMDYRNTVSTAAELGICWNQLNNGHTEPADLYGIQGIPHLILFSPDGKILKRGFAASELDAIVAAALGR